MQVFRMKAVPDSQLCPCAAVTHDRYQQGTINPETLSGLQAKHIGIWAYCERCQHPASLDIEVLLKRLPGSLGVPEVGKKLKCSECGKVDVFSRPDWKTW